MSVSHADNAALRQSAQVKKRNSLGCVIFDILMPTNYCCLPITNTLQNPSIYIHELVVRARQLAAVAQLERCTGIAGTQVRFLKDTQNCIFRRCFWLGIINV